MRASGVRGLLNGKRADKPPEGITRPVKRTGGKPRQQPSWHGMTLAVYFR
jgi:hypothetical protein